MKNLKKQAPIIINEGTLVNKKDMIRALETLENVSYQYEVDEKIVSQGEGWIVKIFANKENATLIVNECIFINVFSFDYLKFFTNEKGLTTFALVGNGQTLKLISLEENSRANKAQKVIQREREIEEEYYSYMADETENDEEF